MNAYVWLTEDRRDAEGRLWPDASLDGFWVSEAQTLKANTIMIHGIGHHLWYVEFDGPAAEMPEGFEGRARLYSEITGWSASTAGELRLQLFQQVRASLAKSLVAADDNQLPDPFARDVILDMVQAGRKIAGARGPSELKPVLPVATQLIQKMWPPERKRGMFAKKVDTARVYENIRTAMEATVEAAEEAVDATLDMDAVNGVNRMLRVLGKLARGEATFAEMLKIQALQDQAAIETALDDARARVRTIKDIDVHSPGEGVADASGPGGLGIASPFLQQQVGLAPQPQKADAVTGSSYPVMFVEASTWLTTRLQLS